jgi:hypothetical protein
VAEVEMESQEPLGVLVLVYQVGYGCLKEVVKKRDREEQGVLWASQPGKFPLSSAT